jgi:hypothetical protein
MVFFVGSAVAWRFTAAARTRLTPASQGLNRVASLR